MRVLISVAEPSADLHASRLLLALKEQAALQGQSIEAFGVGGPLLEKAGLQCVLDSSDLRVMGVGEVISHLPKIIRSLRELTGVAQRLKPDLAILVDYPGFHFKLAKRLKKLGIPMVYYIPPKVWVWRKKRMRFLKDHFVKILSILPFEQEFYQKEGMSITYVGNPLVEELPLGRSKSDARTELGLSDRDQVLVLMPGSRPSEIKRHLKVMLSGVGEAASRLHQLIQVLLPLVRAEDESWVRKEIALWKLEYPRLDEVLKIRVSLGNSSDCLLAADAGVIKSGTSTLEAGILGCPHIVIYRPHPITAWLFRNWVKYSGPVALVNLMTGWKPGEAFPIPEFLMDQVTKQTISDEVISLLTDPARRQKNEIHFQRVRQAVYGVSAGSQPVQGEVSPSERAAQEVMKIFSS